MTLLEAFECSAVLRQASAASRREIAEFGCMKRFEKGQHIFYEKESTGMLYILLEGLVSIYKLNPLGEKKVIFVYGPGSMLNEALLQETPAAASCEVREDAQVLVLTRERLWSLMERDPALTRAVVQSMSLKIRRLYHQLKNTTNALSGEKRLAAKLFKLARDYGVESQGETLIDMNLSITYLADMLGSKRETVSRQAKNLNRLGLIRIQKNRIYISDLQKLSDYFEQP